MKFIIGSTNHAKVQAVKEVLANYFSNAPVETIEVSSDVSPQPIGDEETITGAMNRAKNAVLHKANAIGIGLEGGVRMLNDQMYICNWGALELPDGQVITAGGAQIPIPNEIAREIEKGKELGPVIDLYFRSKGLRQKEGAMGMFTEGSVTRVDLFSHIVHLLIGQLLYYDKNNKNG